MTRRHRISLAGKSGAALRAFFVALLAILPVSVASALDWERRQIERHAAIGEQLAPYVFTFTNSGSSAVTITDVRLTCGCLESELDRKIVPPGAVGKLTVRFDRAGLVGDVARTVIVTTDEPGAEPYQLVLNANLPEAVTFAPRLVFWKTNAASGTKSIDIKVNLSGGLEITRVKSNSDNFETKLVTLEARRHYRLDITPRAAVAKELGIITLETAEKLPATISALTVYAQIR